jgi:glycosyltransferase involved in cell wall biosynthesis
MARSLQQAGHQVVVITFLPNYPAGQIQPAYRGRWWAKERNGEIVIYRYPLFPDHSAKLWRRGLGMASMAASVLWATWPLRRFGPDVVLAQSPPLLLAASAAWLAKVTGAKLVLNLSDLWPWALADLGALDRRSVAYRWLANLAHFLYARARLAIGQSEEILQHLAARAPQTPRLLYRNGVNLASFAPTPPPDRSVARPLRLVYTGLFGLAQGILEICEAIDFQSLGAELHLYGEGAARPGLLAFIAAHPERGVFVHQPVPQAQVPPLLAGADGVLVAQKGPVFGTVPSKLYEAMAAGRPVVYVGAGEGAELVQRAGAGWVCPPGDLATLRNIVRHWPTDAATLVQMGQQGQHWAYQHLDRELYRAQLLAALARV